MDTALLLRKHCDQNQRLPDETIQQYLSESKLLAKLSLPCGEGLGPIWRIIALSEIPFASRLPYTQELAALIFERFATEQGFSYTGQIDHIVPCYNAMLIEALCKLGFGKAKELQCAVNWILQYQFFRRGGQSAWTGEGISQHGGCLRATPCYIGLAKTVKALLHYQKFCPGDGQIEEMIQQGIEIILSHQLCWRLSEDRPISKHILEPAFPPSYVLNIVELLEIAHMTGNISHPSCQKAIDYILSIQNENGTWPVGYQYSSEGYISFDGKKKNADWISYLLSSYLAPSP